MSIRDARVAPIFVLLAALSSFGCDDNGSDTLIGPTRLVAGATSVGTFIGVHPSELQPQILPGAFCPATPAFFVPFDLAVRAHGGLDLSLHRVEIRFADTAGALAAIRTMSQAELGTLFGATHVPAGGTRTFPLSFPFGCAAVSSGTLNVLVVALDARGFETRSSVVAPVRMR